MTFELTHPANVSTADFEAAVLESAAAILNGRLRTAGQAITSPDTTIAYLNLRMVELEHEVFFVLFLDTRNRVIAEEPMFRGTIDGAAVYPREVVKAALAHNAAALIVAHNHPSGVGEPSSADQALTRRLREALALVDVRLLDHIIIAAEGPVSFAQRGWL